MSVDWDRYSTPEATRLRARKNPEANAVLRMKVDGIRRIDDLKVVHSPISENQAHTDVFLPKDGEDLTEARYRLTKIAEVVISFEASSLP